MACRLYTVFLRCLLMLVLVLAACGEHWVHGVLDKPVCDTLDTDPECEDLYGPSSGTAAPTSQGASTAPATTGDDPETTTGSSSGSSDATGEIPSTTGTAGSTTEPWVPLPEVVDGVISPPTIEVEGDLSVDVITKNAEGVRMAIDGGEPVELTAMSNDWFVGTIPVYSGLANGTHSVSFTAWQGDLLGEPFPAEYTVNLSPAGSESLWDASGELSPGVAVGVVVSQASVFEFGSLTIDGEDRCYVRRRSESGTYTAADVRMVTSGEPCTAKAIAADADGSLYFLATRVYNDDHRWWLGRLDGWDGELISVGWGAVGEVARALAARPGTNEVAVCGTIPTGEGDLLDTKVAVFRKDGPGLSPAPYDYLPAPDNDPHKFTETARDCVYRDGTLGVVGEAYGPHEAGPMEHRRDRLFVLEIDTTTGAGAWKVAPKEGLHVQSGAWAVTVDDAGNYITAGYVCGDVCAAQLQLRRLLPGGEPGGWSVFPELSVSLVADIAWSPAGYAIVASGEAQDLNIAWWTDFWVQAWRPDEDTPAWTYGRSDAEELHLALGVAPGPKGRVYTVGLAVQADVRVPVFVILNP